MKKILSAALALALVVSMGVPTFGETITADSGGAGSAAVQGKYAPGMDAPETICVSVTWEDMTFTYRKSADEWDPADHDYKSPSADGAWDALPKYITIHNRSNVSVLACIAFQWNGSIVGGFGEDDKYNKHEGSSWVINSGVRSQQPIFVTGGTLAEDGDIGTITVSISSFE